MHNMTAFQRDILHSLHKAAATEGVDAEAVYGLALKRELERYYDTEINHGRLYPNLDGLSEKGYITKGQLDQRTNWYALSDRGQRVLEERADWERGSFDAVDTETDTETETDDSQATAD
jgi:PadR family transcriptional regulator PadR